MCYWCVWNEIYWILTYQIRASFMESWLGGKCKKGTLFSPWGKLLFRDRAAVQVRGLNGERKKIKGGGLWSTPGKFFETTPFKTSESAPFNRCLPLYTYVYIQSGSEETSISIKTDTHQSSHDVNHFLSNQNWGQLPPSLYDKEALYQTDCIK